jgi:hypothetical protein
MDVLEVVPRIALVCLGVAGGVALVELFDPAAPPIGRVLRRVTSYLQDCLFDDE